MEKYIIEIPVSERDFFLQLLKRLPKIKFKKVENAEISPEKQEILDDLKEALIQVKLHKEGKIKLKTAQEALKELRAELENEKI